MEEYIAKSSNDYNEDIKEIYSILAKEYLGKEYFCALDVLYKTYAATSEQQKIIWGSIIGLTYMLIESPVIPSTIPSQVCTLLEAYKKKLDAHPSKDLTPFYIHNEPFKTDKEDQLIKYITDTFSSFPDTLLTFIKSSVNRKSKYKISVDDFSSFEKNFKNHINDISAKIEESREYIINTYHTIQHDSAIVKAVHENRLIFETAIFNKHINFLTSGISKYHERLLKDFSSFLTKVRQASKENPEKQPSLSIETDYLKKLETDIQYTYSILKQHLETGFKNLSPFLTLRRLGYIETFKYPIDCFLEKDFLRITHELKKCYVGLSDEYVIHQCKSRGLRFPLSRYDMIRFLLERV